MEFITTLSPLLQGTLAGLLIGFMTFIGIVPLLFFKKINQKNKIFYWV